MNQRELIEKVKAAKGWNQEQIADLLEANTGRVTHLKNGTRPMNNEEARRLAEAAGFNPFEVIAELEIARASDDATRSAWGKALASIKRGAAVLVLAVLASLAAHQMPDTSSALAALLFAALTIIFIMSSCSSSIGDHLFHPFKMVLFPEFPAATLGLLVAWLRAVPKIEPESPRFGYYCRYWNVPWKIQTRTTNRDMPPEVLACTITDADLNAAYHSLTTCGHFPHLAISQPEQGELFAPTASRSKAACNTIHKALSIALEPTL